MASQKGRGAPSAAAPSAAAPRNAASSAAAPRAAAAIAAAPRTAASTKSAPSNEDIYRLIAETAYFKAKARGFEPGGEVQDWIEAEAEIRHHVEKGTVR
jgi:Protein of unknown function (DUF2934)